MSPLNQFRVIMRFIDWAADQSLWGSVKTIDLLHLLSIESSNFGTLKENLRLFPQGILSNRKKTSVDMQNTMAALHSMLAKKINMLRESHASLVPKLTLAWTSRHHYLDLGVLLLGVFKHCLSVCLSVCLSGFIYCSVILAPGVCTVAKCKLFSSSTIT